MGLASALTTALTGLTAAETQIDVVGNNLANSQTVGYKASETVFATQFLRTLAIGSAPTGSNGGTNPRQIGLGTQVAEIAPNFSQGTVEISSNPSDLAIQGDGFFIVEGGGGGEQLYTRNGIFKTNGDNELVTVTGNRLLGYQVDDTFTLQSTQVVPLTIPLGSASVAQATTIMTMEGALTPVGDIADTAEVVESAVLGDSNVPRPDIAGSGIVAADVADSTAVAIAHNDTGGGLEEGQTYRYRIAFVDDGGTEAPPSDEIVVTVPAGNATDDNQVTLNGLPAPLTGQYASVNVYRTSAGGTNDFGLVGTAAVGASFTDTGLTAPGAALDDSTIDGNYSYLITYHLTGVAESRPSVTIGPQNVVDGRIQLTDLPTPPVPVSGSFPAYDEVRIYRNLASDSSSFYLVDTVAPGTDYTDNKTDAEISDLTNPNNKAIDLDGPRVNTFTLLTDVVKRDGLTYEQIFKEGDLGFTGRKGGRQLDTTDFTIDATTTVQDLIDFMQASMGVQTSSDDPQDPIPGSLDKTSPGATGTLATGGSIVDGRIRFVSNNGVDNALDIGLSAFLNNATDGTQASPNLGFGTIQEAEGQSAVSDFIVYDSLGVPIKVRLTAVLEARTGTQTTYRWFADSPDNDPLSGTEIAVGTGLLSFDGQGNFINTTNNEVSIERRNIPSASPLAFDLDFGAVSGLAVSESTLAAARQDGTPPGTLNSFVIGEDGFIRGVFSNGATRTLGAIRLARFSNPTGLAQRGENLFSAGSNSGLPVQGGPGQNGLGQIVAGAVELSNTDIGQNLIDLVLAQTQYRGNTRVISAAQQLLDELLSLRR